MRSYDSRTTFWGMLSQVFRQSSLRDAVRELQAIDRLLGRPIRSGNTGPYSNARKRLPLQALYGAHEQLYRKMDLSTQGSHGGRLLSVDATGICLDDTDINRQTYSYAPCQKEGCGFPVMQMVTLMDLDNGCLVDAVESPNRAGESPLFSGKLIEHVREADTVVADRAYCGYYNFFCLKQKSAHGVMRLHASRDASALKRSDDVIVKWKRPSWSSAPPHLTREEWEGVPKEQQIRLVRLRVVRKGYRAKEILLATSLLDTPMQELFELYHKRWEIETAFAHIKTTMEMDHLHVKTPEMARKHMYLFFIAHNLIRWLMLRAGALPTVLSFKGALDCVKRWASEMATLNRRAFKQLFDEMLEVIAADQIPFRPNRFEPRCVKKRPKGYQRMTRPRAQYSEREITPKM